MRAGDALPFPHAVTYGSAERTNPGPGVPGSTVTVRLAPIALAAGLTCFCSAPTPFGQDVFSRTLYAARVSLLIGW